MNNPQHDPKTDEFLQEVMCLCQRYGLELSGLFAVHDLTEYPNTCKVDNISTIDSRGIFRYGNTQYLTRK